MHNIDRVIKIANYIAGFVPTSLKTQSYKNIYGERWRANKSMTAVVNTAE